MGGDLPIADWWEAAVHLTLGLESEALQAFADQPLEQQKDI